MKAERLENLADGIFAIVMTLLVLELRPLELVAGASNAAVWQNLLALRPLFFSYFLTFALLFTYWRAHHYYTSVFARNIDLRLTNINALFLALVTLVPFSAQLLGAANTTELAVSVYGLHIILLGLTLWWMRNHILDSQTIDNTLVSPRELRHSTIRLAVPIICSIIAIGLSFWNPTWSLGLYTFAILFNLLPQSAGLISRLLLGRD